jgi:hypothetical protein
MLAEANVQMLNFINLIDPKYGAYYGCKFLPIKNTCWKRQPTFLKLFGFLGLLSFSTLLGFLNLYASLGRGHSLGIW